MITGETSVKYLRIFPDTYTQVYSFKGVLKHETITKILNDIRSSLTEDYILSKRMFAIANELLENALYHREKKDDEIEICVMKSDTCFRIITFNTSTKNELEKLQLRSEDLNSLTTEELKEMYKSKLLNDNINSKGTIGVGLQLVRLKSKNKILISLEESNNQNIVIVDVRIDI
jgi:hypothetical protein